MRPDVRFRGRWIRRSCSRVLFGKIGWSLRHSHCSSIRSTIPRGGRICHQRYGLRARDYRYRLRHRDHGHQGEIAGIRASHGRFCTRRCRRGSSHGSAESSQRMEELREGSPGGRWVRSKWYGTAGETWRDDPGELIGHTRPLHGIALSIARAKLVQNSIGRIWALLDVVGFGYIVIAPAFDGRMPLVDDWNLAVSTSRSWGGALPIWIYLAGCAFVLSLPVSSWALWSGRRWVLWVALAQLPLRPVVVGSLVFLSPILALLQTPVLLILGALIGVELLKILSLVLWRGLRASGAPSRASEGRKNEGRKKAGREL